MKSRKVECYMAMILTNPDNGEQVRFELEPASAALSPQQVEAFLDIMSDDERVLTRPIWSQIGKWYKQWYESPTFDGEPPSQLRTPLLLLHELEPYIGWKIDFSGSKPSDLSRELFQQTVERTS